MSSTPTFAPNGFGRKAPRTEPLGLLGPDRLSALMLARAAWILLVLCTVCHAAPARAERFVIDMAHRRVKVPDHVHTVVTVGPVPVINSFIFAFGRASAILNGLPQNYRTSHRWIYQNVFSPNLLTRPAIQSSGGSPAIEDIIAIHPDLVLAMDLDVVESLRRVGLPALYLAWRDPDDVKAVMRVLGDLFEEPEVARAYSDYFDGVLAIVQRKLASNPSRPRVLYCSLGRLTQPHLIAEWWIDKAGGQSVTADGRVTESTSFSLEQLLSWNPEVLIVTDPREIGMAYSDPRFASLSAVRNHRVFAAPNGAHLWGNRTVEQPLVVMWAAKMINPTLFKDVDVEREVAGFYSRFFRVQLRPEQVRDILAGTPE